MGEVAVSGRKKPWYLWHAFYENCIPTYQD